MKNIKKEKAIEIVSVALFGVFFEWLGLTLFLPLHQGANNFISFEVLFACLIIPILCVWDIRQTIIR